MIPAGSDKLRDIGRPRATWPTHPTAADVTTALQEWQALVKDMFPPKAKEAKTRFEIAAHYKEEDIDAAVARKEAALDAYRKEAEAARKEEAAAKKRAAADAAGLRHSSGKAAAGAATGLRK
eukprot:jgi/Chrzof1/5397/Cz16g01110.t1